MKNVLDIGQCQADHALIRRLIEGSFSAHVAQAHDALDALEQLRAGKFDLVLVNRKLNADYSDGLEIVKQIKAEPTLASVPVMLVSNYPECQKQAVAAGAEPGFGKSETNKPETRERLKEILG
ncbi:MAG: response regulator [Planctomycetia bacterium]|nr:response regulator [Planctomycetia bacterium]